MTGIYCKPQPGVSIVFQLKNCIGFGIQVYILLYWKFTMQHVCELCSRQSNKLFPIVGIYVYIIFSPIKIHLSSKVEFMQIILHNITHFKRHAIQS